MASVDRTHGIEREGDGRSVRLGWHSSFEGSGHIDPGTDAHTYEALRRGTAWYNRCNDENPRTCEPWTSAGRRGSTRMSRILSTIASSAAVISTRARCEPMQRCGPTANAR